MLNNPADICIEKRATIFNYIRLLILIICIIIFTSINIALAENELGPTILFVDKYPNLDEHSYDNFDEAYRNVAKNGTIYLGAGTYGNIDIKGKSVNIIGIKDETIIDDFGSTMEIRNMNYIKLENLIIEGGITGIYISKCPNVNVFNCTIDGSEYGLILQECQNALVLKNTIYGEDSAIFLKKSQYCNISDNTLKNGQKGLTLYDSNNNVIDYNRIGSCIDGIKLIGDSGKNNIGNNNEFLYTTYHLDLQECFSSPKAGRNIINNIYICERGLCEKQP